MQTITGGGAFTSQNISDINANFASLTGTTGNLIYCQTCSIDVIRELRSTNKWLRTRIRLLNER
jgi:hypothetical protein